MANFVIKNKQKSAALADLNKASRRRSFLAVKAIKSPAATKAAKRAAKGVTSPSNTVIEGENNKGRGQAENCENY